jgi:hypothetical protein
MLTRLDFISESTGRVYLKTLLDTPSEGFTAALSLKIRRKLVRVASELEDTISEELGKTINVRLTMDSYEACVFWYIALFRPFTVLDDPVLGKKPWNVYELMDDPAKAHLLKRLDWGVFWDHENNWIVIVWEEAIKGVLHDMRSCPSWNKILTAEEKRLRIRLDWTWWKKCAESFSYVIPAWRLRDMSYMGDKLWHRPGAQYEGITVVDMAGIDIPSFQVGNKISATLPIAKRAHFAHHYVSEEDKREYLATISQFEKKDLKEKQSSAKGMHARLNDERRNTRRRSKRKLARETPEGRFARIVAQLGTALGKAFRKGRPSRNITPEQCEKQFEYSVDAYINGDLHDPQWNRIELLLNDVEELIKDHPELPELRIARRWLLWRNKGEPGIMAYFERSRGNSAAYKEILKHLGTSKRRQLTELVELLKIERET